jgi:adenylate cyclase
MRKKLVYSLLLTAVCAGLVTYLDARHWLDRWEFTTWNWRVQTRARPGVATEDIKVVMIDEESLQWAADVLQVPWPWPREMYSAILQFLHRGGARGVAFDLLFFDHSFRDAHDDELFGEAIRTGPPFAAAAFLGDAGGGFTQWPAFMPDRSLRVTGLDSWAADREVPGLFMQRAAFPIPAVATNATLVGDVKGVPDPDSIIRRVHLFRVFDERAVPALGLAAYMAATQAERGSLPEMQMTAGAIRSGRRTVPIDEQGRAILRYRGPPGTHERFQAGQILRDEIRLQDGETPTLSPIAFNNKYVLLGVSAPALLDLRPTPISNVTPGVEVHATLLDNYLSNDFVRLLPPRLARVFLFALTWFAVCCVLWSGRVWRMALAFVFFLALPGWLGALAYDFSIWWPMVPQTLALLLGMGGALAVNYALEGRQKLFIKNAFKHYLSPDVIEQIMKHPDQLKLGGERRELTIFFSDLAGFSSISERLDPQALTQLLNEYLTDMTNIILAEGGTLDKYEGDAIIAFWNAPLPQPDHAVRAVRAALRCQQQLAARQAEFAERAGGALRMRIGINTGEVVVGNMGSRERFDYTVLGDAANLAARLEGANKAFGTATMIAASTWSATGDAFTGRTIGRLTVVGRQQPVRVYELLGEANASTHPPLAGFEAAVEAVERKEWAQAKALFEKWTDDPLSCKYVTQCQKVLAGSPPDWDGVWNMTEK